jgi:hypothetical protein|tara:strand:+ start:401 stop:538 length:138 start_codon:yes stop_codon:yes gene_type:complete
MNEEIKELAESISFRLMATIKHPDHNWLVEQLKILVDRTIRDTEL